jgi:hypothetical protein
MPDTVLDIEETVMNFSSYMYVNVSQAYNSNSGSHIVPTQHFHSSSNKRIQNCIHFLPYQVCHKNQKDIWEWIDGRRKSTGARRARARVPTE